MRTIFFLFLDLALLFSVACDFDESRRASSALGEAPPATPQMIEFATDLGMSWNPGMHRGMWRNEIDDVRPAGKVHIVTEAECPERYHVLVTGAERSEQIFIGKTMYLRKGDGPWTQHPMPMHHMILSSCGQSGPPKDDPARFRLLAEQFRNEEISGPKLREINGHPCREWTRTVQDFNKSYILTTCYDVKTHATVQSSFGNLVTTFDWESKVDIKPPY